MDLAHINDEHNEHNKYIIGVMALQGAVEEHMNSIRKLGATAIEVSNWSCKSRPRSRFLTVHLDTIPERPRSS